MNRAVIQDTFRGLAINKASRKTFHVLGYCRVSKVLHVLISQSRLNHEPIAVEVSQFLLDFEPPSASNCEAMWDYTNPHPEGCPACGLPLKQCPGGWVCSNGHGH